MVTTCCINPFFNRPLFDGFDSSDRTFTAKLFLDVVTKVQGTTQSESYNFPKELKKIRCLGILVIGVRPAGYYF